MDRNDRQQEIENNRDIADSVDVEATFDKSDEPPSIDTPDTAKLSLENIGGIDDTELTIRNGINVLAGQNATNRTSTLRGLCAVLGADETTPASRTLSTDADTGKAVLQFDGETYTRTYERTGRGAVRTGGEPFTDADTVDAFVALLEENPARRAVERGADAGELRDILMRPVDTTEIDRKIDDLVRQRRNMEERIESIEKERDRLPKLETRRQNLREELEDTETEIADLQDEIETYDADKEEAQRAEELLEDLQDLRSDLGNTEDRVEYHCQKVDEYRDELDRVNDELTDVDVPEDELERLESELSRLQNRKRRIEDTIADLDAVIGVNEDLVSDGDGFPNADLMSSHDVDDQQTSTAEELTAELNPDTDTVECWTCGSDVTRSAVEEQLDTLRTLRSKKRDAVTEIKDEIKTLTDQKADLESRRENYDELQSRAETLEEQIEYHESEAQTLQAEAESLRDDIAALEDQVEETDELRESDLVDAYQRLSELEYDRGRIDQELTDIEEEITRIQGLADEQEDLKSTHDDITAALEELRSRVDDAEQAAVEAFNTHIETVVNRLDYQNIERIWLERKSTGESAEAGKFELHIVREGDGGTVYEDTVDTLSESEREVVGLVVALTGYIVHRVYEDVPFLILDSMEAIDAPRIASVLDYFGRRTGFLLAALLPEDADAIQIQDETDEQEAPPLYRIDEKTFATR